MMGRLRRAALRPNRKVPRLTTSIKAAARSNVKRRRAPGAEAPGARVKPMIAPGQSRCRAAQYDRLLRPTDQVLCDLCRRFPGPSLLGGVIAKVMLIGRSYATGLD